MAFDSMILVLRGRMSSGSLIYRFFQQELGWQQTKVDELLLPIIQKINKRGQVTLAFFSSSTVANCNLGRRHE